MNGRRQLVFVTGEPGIGKTALVEAFLSQIDGDQTLRIGRGQCVELYGAGEAYLPLLEALGRLGRAAGGEQVVQILKQHAPTWLIQLPALLADPDLGHPTRAATRMREALALARSLGHPFSVVYACHFAASFHLYRRERDAVQELEDEALACSTEHEFRLFPMMGAIHRGWLLSEQARGEDALAQMREGLAALRAIGIEFRRPAFLALVPEACEKAHQRGEGLSAVAEHWPWRNTPGSGTGMRSSIG